MEYYAILSTNQKLEPQKTSPAIAPVQSINDFKSCFIDQNDIFEIESEIYEEIISSKTLDILDEKLSAMDNLL